jgi:hypothetical protein
MTSKTHITNYSPFGVLLQNRNFTSEGYRYGFNGQEGDDEVAGEGNSYTAEFWQYDSRLARRWNLDPVIKIHESPYAVISNNPLLFIDIGGADTTYASHYSGSKNLMIIILGPDEQNNADPAKYKHLNESGWDYVVVDNINAANEWMEEKGYKKGSVDNLTIRHHGQFITNVGEYGAVLSYDEKGGGVRIFDHDVNQGVAGKNEEKVRTYESFKNVLDVVSDNANVFLVGCKCGTTDIGAEVYKLINKKNVTVYTNTTYSSALEAIFKLKTNFAYPVIEPTAFVVNGGNGIKVTDKDGTRVTKNNIVLTKTGNMYLLDQEWLLKTLKELGFKYNVVDGVLRNQIIRK